jgi:hypothetical protein
MSGELGVPLIVKGPKITEEDANDDIPLRRIEGGSYDSDPRPIIESINIKSNITNRFDKTTITCFVKNPSIRIAHEIGFEIELPFKNYTVTNLTLGIHGDNSIYKGTQNKNAEQLYNTVSNLIISKNLVRNQSMVVLKEIKNGKPLATRDATMLGMRAIIPPGEKLFITLEYEGPLLENKKSISDSSWVHVSHINPNQLVENFSVKFDIIETLPIVEVLAAVSKDQWAVLDLVRSNVKYGNTSEALHVSFDPKESNKQDGGYDMNVEFYTIYGRDKNFLLPKVGQDITDISSLSKRDRMVGLIMYGVDFMFRILLMIPFIIMTEMINGFGLVMSLFLGGEAEKRYSNYYLNEQTWYEKELAYEFTRLDRHLGNMEKFESMTDKNGIFEDTFDAAAFYAENSKKLPVKAKKPPATKPNNPGNSIFIDFKKVLAATPKKEGASTSSTNIPSRFLATPKKGDASTLSRDIQNEKISRFLEYKEPLVRKF